MIITFFTYIYNGDEYIENYIKNIKNIIDIENHKIIIYFINDSNSNNSNNLIKRFIENSINTILVERKIKDHLNKINCINLFLDNCNTDYFINIDIDNEINKNIIKIFMDEIKHKNINIFYSYLKFFDNEIINTKKIFFENHFNDNYNFKIKLLEKCVKYHKKINNKIVDINNYDLFDFFFIEKDNILDINNYYLYNFIGNSCIIKTNLLKKFKLKSELDDLAFFYFYLELHTNNISFHRCKINLLVHKRFDYKYKLSLKKKIIIKDFHPIFNLINTKLDVVIPYRNRKKELDIFLESFRKSFENYFDYRIILCIQNDNKSFKRSIVNYGVNFSKNENILITDVDIIYNKIPICLIKRKNIKKYIKVYGTKKYKISSGGGALLVNYKDYTLHNGFSNKYSGWGCEDIDFTYRLFFHNIDIKDNQTIYREDNNKFLHEIKKKNNKNKKKHLYLNNFFLIQNIINYNLLYYFENKEKFELINNSLFYKKTLFLEITKKDNNIFFGSLYDLISKNKIYTGIFMNYLPNGLGLSYNIFNKNYIITGLWLNGYCIKNNINLKKLNFFSNNINKYGIIEKNVLNLNCDYDLYKHTKRTFSGMNEMNNEYDLLMDKNITKLFIKI